MQFNKCVCSAQSLLLKHKSEDIDMNVSDTDRCGATRTMTSQGSSTKAFNHKADNELPFLFLNISVSVDRACPSPNKTPAQICLNQQLSNVINAIFLEKEKRSGNVLELQRRDVNKLSGNCSRNYKFLQDTLK